MTQAQILPLAAPFFSAFFGAASAFIFASMREHHQKRRKNLDEINVAIYGMVMTVEKLLNLKSQFLVDHEAEFEEAAKILGQMNPSSDERTLQKITGEVSDIFGRVSQKSQDLNGV